MSLLTRKRTVLAKSESTYGVDASPTGSANAMLVKNLNINPVQAELVSRDLIRPYLGNSEQLLAQTYVTVDFEVEFVGSGTVGLAPAYEPLLKACGFTPASTTTPISIIRSGSIATASLTAHGYAVGDKVVISGATETEYNGTQTITGVTTNAFDFSVSGTPATPATGSPVVHSAVVYSPISTAFQSCTIYYNVDGVQHVLKGCFGNFEISLAVKQIPVFKFTMTGLYVPPADVVAPSVDFSAFMIPQIANTQNTPGFSLYGFTGAPLESMSLNMSNDVQYITLIGSESVKILDRKPSGTMVFEAPTIASKDFFDIVKNSTTGVMTIDHGSKSGYKVSLSAPRVLLGNPTYQDSNGVQMLSAPFTVNPVTGNDEITITVK